MAVDFDPKTYWSQRLADVSGLRGVGHLEYDARYNRWLYRQKGRVLDEAVRNTPAGATALDVGSGVGWVVRYLQTRGLTVSGCDISEDAVAALSRAIPPVTSSAWPSAANRSLARTRRMTSSR
jgi:2-polyprenyl-3-methyl-5-hydroxy-6-metoxy-1,4-benzoquinol methylase